MGWQASIEQTIKFILAQLEREACFGPQNRLPDTLQFRITYDGAEVGGHPGVIAYLIPMNLGHEVESARAAYPILFTRCKENQENLTAEFQDVVTSILATRDGEGLLYQGRVHKVDWWQSMDLASFWKQHGLTFNCGLGYCPFCPCTHKDDHDLYKWSAEEWYGWEGRPNGVLPIGLDRTVFCATHAKMRVVGKLMNLLAAESVARGTVDHWTRVVRALGVPAFKVNVTNEDGVAYKNPTTTALIGPHCDLLLDNYEQVVRESGIQNHERMADCYKSHGPGDPKLKTGPQLRACLAGFTSVAVPRRGNNEELLKLYLDNIGDHVCSECCEMEASGLQASCKTSSYNYAVTNDLCTVLRIWKAFGKVNKVIRQLDPVTEAEIEEHEQDLEEFGEAFIKQYDGCAVTCYVHMICCHSAMLLKRHGSIGMFANQGAEAAHKLIRQKLNHTGRGGGKHGKPVSLAILERHYRIEMLRLIYETKIEIEMTEADSMDTDESEEDLVLLGDSFMDLKAKCGVEDVEEHREKRKIVRAEQVTEVDGVAITFVEHTKRRQHAHKGCDIEPMQLT